MSTSNGQLVHLPKQTTLSRFEAVRYALEQARTVDEVKHIRDQAEALRLYAKQAGESLELQNQFGELKLLAERKAGKLLSAMEKNQGARGTGVRSQAVTTLPRLKDIGISKMQSSRWQREASVPERVFARHIADVQDKGKELTSTGLLDLAKQLTKQAQRRKRCRAARAYAAKVKTPADQGVLLGDMGLLWDRLKDDSVDLVFTDPPWSNLECYVRLAQLAAAKLKPGGLCLCYVGKHYLPRVLDAMRPHLEYWWIFGVRLAGCHYRAHDRGIQTKWAALLAFHKGKRPTLAEDLCDLLVEGGGRQKDLHACQQSPSEAEYLIEKLAKPGGLVVDPFCGSGTIPAAAKKMGRRWLRVEIDPDHVAIARKRLAEQPAGVRS
jgi:SAM-dependent methyltransferase